MSQLSVDQKTVMKLLSDQEADFLIPDYQRPYAWGKGECDMLWNDLFNFAFPDKDYSKFKSVDKYFLGPIVTYPNDKKQQEVIDGQQRLTTLMLLLRAFYNKNRYEKENSLTNPKNLESLGNKVLLESSINIAASDYKFADKVKYYKGEIFSKKKGKYIGPTNVNELQVMADSRTDFTEDDIVQRNALIIQKFIDYLKKNDLTK